MQELCEISSEATPDFERVKDNFEKKFQELPPRLTHTRQKLRRFVPKSIQHGPQICSKIIEKLIENDITRHAEPIVKKSRELRKSQARHAKIDFMRPRNLYRIRETSNQYQELSKHFLK